MKRCKWFLASVLILVVVYSNAAVILNYPLALFVPGLSLPLPGQLEHLFMLYGMSGDVEMTNRQVEIYGISPATPERPQGDIILLDTSEYFPFSRAEALWRVWLTRNVAAPDGPAEKAAYAALAARIRGRYNRLNPTAPLEKIVIVLVEWQRSLEGYDSLKTNEDLTILYAD